LTFFRKASGVGAKPGTSWRVKGVRSSIKLLRRWPKDSQGLPSFWILRREKDKRRDHVFHVQTK
jgi:hypothetical protein